MGTLNDTIEIFWYPKLGRDGVRHWANSICSVINGIERTYFWKLNDVRSCTETKETLSIRVIIFIWVNPNFR